LFCHLPPVGPASSPTGGRTPSGDARQGHPASGCLAMSCHQGQWRPQSGALHPGVSPPMLRVWLLQPPDPLGGRRDGGW
jgi:hypothetical protein